MPVPPEIEAVVVYRCPFCKRIYFRERGVVAHAEKCFRNPARRSCFTCKPTGDTEGIDLMRYCANGVYLASWRCCVCGEDCDDGTCDTHPDAKPVHNLRVQCDKWEG